MSSLCFFFYFLLFSETGEQTKTRIEGGAEDPYLSYLPYLSDSYLQ